MSTGQKNPFAVSLNRFAAKKVNDAFQIAGKALPCSVVSVEGAIVTVKFEINSSFTLPNVTVPMAGAEYIRYPIQPNDKGVVFPADARLSGVSGIGGGVADLSTPGNLTALVFVPISNMDWSTVDHQAVTIYGPNGVALRDTDNQVSITITPSGIVMEADQITMNGPTAVNDDLSVSGNIDGGGDLSTFGAISAGNGDSGIFTSKDNKLVTVIDGIITDITP